MAGMRRNAAPGGRSSPREAALIELANREAEAWQTFQGGCASASFTTTTIRHIFTSSTLGETR
jgi:hypothetical protein